jgi:hypothetical protein
MKSYYLLFLMFMVCFCVWRTISWVLRDKRRNKLQRRIDWDWKQAPPVPEQAKAAHAKRGR